MDGNETVIFPPAHLRDLRSAAFNRQQSAPNRTDYYYLHFSDLLLAVRAHASAEPLTILDFGAGGSPYKFLFPNAQYKTADLEGAGSDFVINKEGYINAPDQHFDLVLSTQVLEHCRFPDRYLSEAARVLKADGKLVLSTHGLFEEHGCPYDFFRWTAGGLRSVIEENGFTVDSMAKVTSGPRAALHLLQSALSQRLLDNKILLVRLLGRPLFRILLARRFWNAFLDRAFPEYRIVKSNDLPLTNTYVALLASARLRKTSHYSIEKN